MAVMEITAVAEKDAELRKSAFKPNSPACKAVVDQVVKIIEKADSKLLDQLRRYQEFYEEGEREILLTEVSSLREQLLQYHGRNSIQGNSNHDIEPQLRNTLDELQECMRNLNYCLEENAKLSREINSLHSTLSSTNATKVSTEGSFCEAQAVLQIGLKHETQMLKHRRYFKFAAGIRYNKGHSEGREDFPWPIRGPNNMLKSGISDGKRQA